MTISSSSARRRIGGMREHGFTLMEIVIAAVVVGVLAATAALAYNYFITRTKTTQARATMQALAQALQAGSITSAAPVAPGTWTQAEFSTLAFTGQLPPDVVSFTVSDTRELTAGFANGIVCWGLTFPARTGAPATGDVLCGTSGEPSAPTGVYARPGDKKLIVSWDLPGDGVAGDRVVSWSLEVSSDGGQTWTKAGGAVTPTHSFTIPGLTNGTEYTVRLTGQTFTELYASTTTTGIPAATPQEPTNLNVTMGDLTAVVSFDLPTDDGGNAISAYKAQYSMNGAAWESLSNGPASSPYTAKGLTAGGNYRFRLAAVNEVGDSEWSTPTTAEQAVTVPTKVRALAYSIPSNKTVRLDWTAPSEDGFSPLVEYRVEYSSDGTTWTPVTRTNPLDLSEDVTGLDQYTAYTFRVTAVNAIGDGLSDTIDSGMPNRGPSAVQGLNATYPGVRGQVSVAWTPPSSTGIPASGTIRDYVVEYKKDTDTQWQTFNHSVSSTRLTYPVTGLQDSTLYNFRVSAQNSGLNTGVPTVIDKLSPSEPASVSSVSVKAANSTSGGRLTASFTAVANPGVAVNYTVEYQEAGEQQWTPWTTITNASPASTASTTITGLKNGTDYTVKVTPYNTVGSAAETTGDGTTIDNPGAPTISGITFSALDKATIAVTAPSNLGANGITTTSLVTITDYQFQWRVQGDTDWNPGSDSVSATRLDATGLPWNGDTLEFQVQAKNSVNLYSPWSATFTKTMPTEANPPTFTAANITPSTTVLGNYTVAVTAPVNNGGTPVTGYVGQWRLAGDTDWTPGPTSATTSLTFTSIPLGTDVEFSVASKNLVGVGTYSAPVTKTTAATPGAPTFTAANIVPSATTVGNVTVTVTAPTSTGGYAINGYVGKWRVAGDTAWQPGVNTTSTSTALAFTSIPFNSTIEFKVQAKNFAGSGADSAIVSKAMPTAPLAPTLTTVAATTVANRMLFTFTAGGNGGMTVTDYIGQYSSDGGNNWSSTGEGTSPSTVWVDGLTPGTSYQFRMAGKNAMGTGAWSAVKTVTTPTAPAAPSLAAGVKTTTSQTLTIGSQTAALLGNSAVRDYVIEYKLSTDTGWTTFNHTASTSRAPVVTGLTSGKTYNFRVKTVTWWGSSGYSTTATSTLP